MGKCGLRYVVSAKRQLIIATAKVGSEIRHDRVDNNKVIVSVPGACGQVLNGAVQYVNAISAPTALHVCSVRVNIVDNQTIISRAGANPHSLPNAGLLDLDVIVAKCGLNR